MSLQKDLDKLSVHIRNAEKLEFRALIDELKKKYTSEADLQVIDDFIRMDMRRMIDETDAVLREVSIRQQLADISDMVSLSYIAKNYFNKTRQWLYQRINGSMVNKRPARFSEQELDTLNFALRDISQKIGSVNVSA
ncbi:DUF5053 domain-containing protein [Petrimonas sp.]|uniref:DUF5053 domain-containing protein n=1 Tax=Petrimonas sp. TaxID=2023866 RepID=UPI003F516236